VAILAGHRDLFSLVQARPGPGLAQPALSPPAFDHPFGARCWPDNRDPTALARYGGLLVAIALAADVWLYATNKPFLLFTPIDQQSRRAGIAIAAIPGLAYMAAIVWPTSFRPGAGNLLRCTRRVLRQRRAGAGERAAGFGERDFT
jgi:hypothetical protein